VTAPGPFSRLWLGAALGLFALDLAAHLPITDFVDFLAKRYGFFEYDRATQWVFVALGAVTVAAIWRIPSSRRREVRAGLGVLALAIAAAKALLLVSAIENIHYPQYALLTVVLVRAGLGLEGSWLAAVGLGVLDEAYQHAVLPRGTPAYLDANDIVLNGIGALLGVIVAVAWWGRGDPSPLLRPRNAVVVAALSAAAAAMLAPLVPTPFYSTTPGGRHFHLLSPFEATVVLAAIWACARRLAAAPDQAVGSGPYRPRL
jgi:hypothetical protein